MSSFELINIPHFDPEAHNERIQARIMDSVQFRLQQQINLKNDEIARLQSDLSLLKGEIDTFSDTLKAKQKSTKEADKDINQKVTQAKHEAELKILQCKKEHSKKLQLIEQQHQSEVQSLQQTLEKTIFQNFNQSNEISRKKSLKEEEFNSEIDKEHEDIEIDDFLESLQTTKTIAKEKIQEIKKPKKMLTEADLEIRDQNLEQKMNLISSLEERKKKLKNKIEQVKENILQIKKDIDYDVNTEPDPTGKLHKLDLSKDALLNGSYDNNPEGVQVDEQNRPYLEKVQNSMRKLDELKKKYQTTLNKLRKKIRIEHDSIQSKQQQIAKKENENKLMDQKIIKLKQKLDEIAERQNKERERERLSRENSIAMNSKLMKALSSMTPQQKEIKLQSLIVENKALKREIFRLDNMIYGKAGRYHSWKDI